MRGVGFPEGRSVFYLLAVEGVERVLCVRLISVWTSCCLYFLRCSTQRVVSPVSRGVCCGGVRCGSSSLCLLGYLCVFSHVFLEIFWHYLGWTLDTLLLVRQGFYHLA